MTKPFSLTRTLSQRSEPPDLIALLWRSEITSLCTPVGFTFRLLHPLAAAGAPLGFLRPLFTEVSRGSSAPPPPSGSACVTQALYKSLAVCARVRHCVQPIMHSLPSDVGTSVLSLEGIHALFSHRGRYRTLASVQVQCVTTLRTYIRCMREALFDGLAPRLD